jgi:spore germination protein
VGPVRPRPLARPLARLLASATVAVAVAVGPATPAAPAPAADPVRPGDLVVTGWVLESSGGRVLEQSPGVGQVDVVGASLRADGRSISGPGPGARRLLRLAHGRGLRVELLLGNYSNRLGGFDPRAAHRLLSDDAHLDRVARRLAGVVEAQGWDGVNVDLELLRRSDAGGLVRLVERLQAELDPERTVSVDVSAATSLRAYRARGYRLAALGAAADVVALMTYDYSGPTWSGPGPIGPLRWQRRAARAALDAVPADRLDLGIAGYGYSWPRGRTGRSLTVRAARRLVARDDARAVWRPAYGEWRARLSDGTVLWWSDARSYRRRVQLAAGLGVHGVAVWRLGSADPIPARPPNRPPGG